VTTSFGTAADGVDVTSSSGAIGLVPVSAGSGNGAAPGKVAAQVTQPAVTPSASSTTAGSSSPIPATALLDYPKVWPGASLRASVSSSGVSDDVVLSNSGAPSRYVFRVTGAKASLTANGGVKFSGKIGQQFSIAPPRLYQANGADLTMASGAKYAVDSKGDLVATVSPTWLAAQPASEFPLTFDPVISGETPAQYESCANGYGCVSSGNLSIGSAGTVSWDAAATFNYSTYLAQGFSVYQADIELQAVIGTQTYATSCDQQPLPCPTTQVNVFDQGVPPNNAPPASFGAIGAGTGPCASSKPINSQSPTLDGVSHFPDTDVAQAMRCWFQHNLSGGWFGFTESSYQGGPTPVRQYDSYFTAILELPPTPSRVTNLTQGQVLASTTPTLQASQVLLTPAQANTLHPMVDYQITTGPVPGSGLVISSGEKEDVFPCTVGQSGCSDATPPWTVPSGALQDGVTYHAWVLTDWEVNLNNTPSALPEVQPPLTWGVTFTVNLGLGVGGPSPTDQVGSVPGQTSTPSQGAPTPGLPGSKATVNLVDGNLSVGFSTPKLNTVSGGLSLGFTYNSLAPTEAGQLGIQGLAGTFYNDTNGQDASADHVGLSPGDVIVGQRVDPTVNFDLGVGGSLVAGQNPSEAAAQWRGNWTVPNTGGIGLWALGDISSDGVQISLGTGTNGNFCTTNPCLSDWGPHALQSSPEFSKSVFFSAAPGQVIPITIDWHHASANPSVVRIFAEQLVGSAPTVYQLPASALTHDPSALPTGWTFNANATQANWVGLTDHGSSVTVFSADGTGYEFINSGGGNYTPPALFPTDNLSVDNSGKYVLNDSSGYIYTFNPSGTLSSVVSAADDVHPSALQYSYSTTTPSQLISIKDPVSTEVTYLYYGGGSNCPSTQTGFSAAPTGLLCDIAFWDGTSTVLSYNPQGELARIQDYVTIPNPTGVVYDLAYDSSKRLTAVRDPLAYQAIQAGERSDCLASATSTPTCDTQFYYDATGLVGVVVQPAPSPGAAQPGRIYCYGYALANTSSALGCAQPASGVTSVGVLGLYPSVGFDERVSYDSRNRIIAMADSAGLLTTYSWDSSDRPVATIQPTGVETSTAYDTQGHPVATYGPAPSSSFQANGQPIAGDGVPTASTQYDGGMSGLAAAWYNNTNVAGNSTLHTLSSLNESWAGGTSPSTGSGFPTAIHSSGFSGSLTGLATLPNPGSVTLNADGGTVSVDGNTLINQAGGPYSGAVRADQPSDWWRLGEGAGATNAPDAVGPNSGTYSASGLTLGQTGPLADTDSTAATFNGSSGLVTVPDSSGLEKDSNQSFSVEAWVKTTNTGTNPIISKLAGAPSYQGWEVGLFNGAPYLLMSSNYGTSAMFAVATSGVANGAWHQIAVTYNGNSLASGVQFFVDGNAVSSGTPYLNNLSGTTVSSVPLSLGGRTQTAFYFNGSIADASLFQGVLSTSRIGAHFTAASQTSAVSISPIVYNTPYPKSVYADTPLSYWRLGEPAGSATAVDSHGTNTATYSGGVALGQSGPLTGDPSTAAAFNGTTSMVTVPDTRLLRFDRTQSFSVEAWVKTTNSTGQEIIASKLAPAPAYTGWEVGILSGRPYMTVIGSNTVSSVLEFSGAQVADGNWHHLVFTYDGSSTAVGVHFLIDGGPDSIGNYPVIDALGSPSVSTAPLTIGSRTGTDTFSGDLSDVAVYPQALNAIQAQTHHQAGVTAPSPGANVHRISATDQQFVVGGHLNVTGASFAPNYGLATQATDADGKVTATSYTGTTGSGISPQYGLPSAVTEDPGGQSLVTATTYEPPGPGSFLRKVGKSLPALNQTTYTNYGGTDGPMANVCGVTAPLVAQFGLVKQETDPAPATGAGDARAEQYVYDLSGRQVGDRIGTVNTVGSAGWNCTTYDSVGRMSAQFFAAVGSQAARTVTYSYSVGSNPLYSSITDTNWSGKAVISDVDLLGRVIGYTDIWGNATSTSYNLAGQQTGTSGPMGPITQNYDPATGRPTLMSDYSTPLSNPTYDAYGRLQAVGYENGTSTGLLYDANGRQNGIGTNDNQGTTGETDTLSAAGRITNQSVFANGSFVDAAGSGPSYSYDGAGRLIQAVMPGVSYNYGYGATTTCPSNGEGANTNRTSLTLTGAGAGTTNYCYDNADRLTSTTSAPSGTVAYDTHGNTVQDGTQTFTYNSSDQLVGSESPTALTTYQPDPLNRVAARSTIVKIVPGQTTSTNTLLGTSVALTTPAGTQVGDLLVASVATSAGTLVVPTGWTLVASQANGGSAWVLDHTVATGDPASWTFADSGLSTIVAEETSYRNTGSTPIDVTATTADGSSTSQLLPAVSTNSAAETLVHVVGYNGTATGTAPAGDIQRGSTSDLFAGLLVSDRYQGPAGPSTAVSATSNSAATSEVITVALAPASNTSRLGYSGENDTSGFTQNSSGAITGLNISLPGGTSYALGPNGVIWSYTNLHGDTVTTTDGNGNRTWTGYWGPYGEAASSNGQPTNDIMSGTNFGYNGQQQKLTDTSAGLVFMGARPYQPATGRFTEVDPVAGGCANSYTYAFGDPLNHPDLSGQSFLGAIGNALNKASCVVSSFYPFKGGKGEKGEVAVESGAGIGGAGASLVVGAGAVAGAAAITVATAGVALLVIGAVVVGYGIYEYAKNC
jgi:RHS repeat-associated protein